jgi:hypothetical protein
VNGFEEIKEEYIRLREEERKTIVNHLQNEGFDIDNPSNGSGKKKYGARRNGKNRLDPPYDLSFWKWISVSFDNDKKAFISLQSFDKDPSSYNLHVLMDRIGIYVYEEKYCAAEARTKMITTNIELPMDENKLRQLVDTLNCLQSIRCEN